MSCCPARRAKSEHASWLRTTFVNCAPLFFPHIVYDSGTDKIAVKGTPLTTAHVADKFYYFAVNKPKVEMVPRFV